MKNARLNKISIISEFVQYHYAASTSFRYFAERSASEKQFRIFVKYTFELLSGVDR